MGKRLSLIIATFTLAVLRPVLSHWHLWCKFITVVSYKHQEVSNYQWLNWLLHLHLKDPEALYFRPVHLFEVKKNPTFFRPDVVTSDCGTNPGHFLSVCPEIFPGILQIKYGRNDLKFHMLMYPQAEHLQNWLDFGHGVLISPISGTILTLWNG